METTQFQTLLVCRRTIYPQQSIYSRVKSNHHKSNNYLANPILTKTISNFFIQPQKIPIGLQLKMANRKPFFAKNRKLVQLNKKNKNKQQNSLIVPNSFKNLLKAKSTVIKHKKDRQFYISRQGRQKSMLMQKVSEPNMNSNLFHPNFPTKKQKASRKSSLFIEKSIKYKQNEQNSIIQNSLNKVLTNQSITQDLSDMVLRQNLKSINIRRANRKKSQKNNTIKWYNKRNVYSRQQKQNFQFDLQPWQNNEKQDSFY